MTEVALNRPGGSLLGTELGDGPVALLLHAGGEHRGVWRNVGERLVRGGDRVLAWDLRGHGGSTAAGADHLAPFADDVTAMIGTLDAMPVVVGASLGGLAALLALADERVRARVAGLVLVDVVPDPQPRRVHAFLAHTMRGEGPRPLVRDILDRAETLREAARALDLPTLLVRGGSDSPLDDADIRRFNQLVGHARVSTIERAGHLIAQDAPAELAEQIANQLEDAEVRRRRIRQLLASLDAFGQHHPTGALADHLERTGDTLQAWCAPDWVTDAGRLHAVYGTDGFRHGFTAPRKLVRAAVGANAEQLIDLFGRCDRARSYPTFLTSTPAIIDRSTNIRQPLTPEQLCGFAELTVANELDVLAHDQAAAATHGPPLNALFSTWHPLLSEPARAAVAAWQTSLVDGSSGRDGAGI